MHGEYKTPGGKLVVVDFEVEDGRLKGVQVSGDFFLYPDEVLEPIMEALEGHSATTTEDQVAETVRQAIPPDAVVLGTSPEGIAIAVQRALLSPGEGE